MPTSDKKVLIVDDDPSVLMLLKEYLVIDQELYGLLVADNAGEALKIIERENVSLVVSDIYMPGMSGLDLLTIIRDRHPRIRVILMTGLNTPKLRKKVEESGCLHFLEKPLKVRHLRQLISQELAKEEGFGGTLRNIQLHDLIQMCCMCAISTAIRVQKGTEEGMIYLEDGDIVHAICGKTEGEDAFYQMLSWRNGYFETLGDLFAPKTTVHKNWGHLLLESARRIDENPNSELQDVEAPNPKIRVLIADDSPIICKILTDMLAADEDIMIAGTAKHGEEALEKLEELNPDLIMLDANMPVMDGRTALKHIMIKHPCPVIVMREVHEDARADILDFLRFGAVDFIRKPLKGENTEDQRARLIERVRHAARADIRNFKIAKALKVLPEKKEVAPLAPRPSPLALIIISSGAGGYADMLNLISHLSQNIDACLMVFQKMPREFVSPLAEYVNLRSRLEILPLAEDSPLVSGRCYIGSAASDIRLYMKKDDDGRPQRLNKLQESDDNSEMTAFDILLCSVSDAFDGPILVVLLSGADVGNLDGLRRIREKNGRIIAQRLNTCMVPHPLKAAIQADLVDKEAEADEIAVSCDRQGARSKYP